MSQVMYDHMYDNLLGHSTNTVILQYGAFIKLVAAKLLIKYVVGGGGKRKKRLGEEGTAKSGELRSWICSD